MGANAARREARPTISRALEVSKTTLQEPLQERFYRSNNVSRRAPYSRDQYREFFFEALGLGSES